MKKTAERADCYKAGARAYEFGHNGEANPHAVQSAEAATWNDGYLDRQKLRANADGELSRRHPGSPLKRVH